MAPGVTGMEGQRDRTKTLLSFGIALTFALSLLANAVKAIVGDRVLWLAEQPALFLLAAPGALFLVFIAARFALLPLVRRISSRRNQISRAAKRLD